MKEVPRWPFDFEVFFDECCAIEINRFGQVNRLLLGFPLLPQPFYPLLEWRIDKDVKRIGTVPKIVSRSTPNDHRVAFARHFPHQLFRNLSNTLGVRDFHHLRVHGSLVAAAKERLEETIVDRVLLFLLRLNGPAAALQSARNPVGKQLIPQFPAEPVESFRGYVACAAAILPFDRQQVNP